MPELVYPSGYLAPDLEARPIPVTAAMRELEAAGRAAGRQTPAEEMLPVVEQNGIVIAQASRGYCHSGAKPLHPVVHLHILNRYGELYLQKRSMKKDLLPGRWDTAVGGHVSYGESILEALYREAGEELGFYDFNPVVIQSYVFESDIETELVNVYAAVGDFGLHPDIEEVEEGRFWSFGEIDSYLSKSLFTPNFELEFQMVRKALEALL